MIIVALLCFGCLVSALCTWLALRLLTRSSDPYEIRRQHRAQHGLRTPPKVKP